MKKILTLFAVVGLIVFSSCEGPEGPPGQNGFDAPIAFVTETTTDFVGPNYDKNVSLTGMLSGDNILVYELVSASNEADRWALLPQIYYFSNGTETAQYNFTFSKNNVRIFIKGSLSDLSGLPSSFTTKKTFRIVIIPGDDDINAKKSTSKADYLDYNAVIKKYNIDDSNVKKLN
ncbi:hypothetical protein SGQ83_03430 [Flavobacterium sp. Fl-318]|uniref:Collagen-like protein n=1 Tax=Flavobacterium cupriresistens TaxID=2893885 RepID=A0ABU4R721_9FLAO|nr:MULTISPECIES: hypothetical protein [unclassified Flavobacterium]MDX6188389.1 hypothetical protein [Flavobacterium sp. Fl-318]UFH44940.1 hypothetical protein LNP23_12220 [Flavobacterium sp. F-323]